MDIVDQIEQLEAMMHTLIHADEVPNTFGMTHQVAATLLSIGAALKGDALVSIKRRLDDVLRTVEENRAVFAIPETWVVDDLYRYAQQVRGKLGRGPFS